MARPCIFLIKLAAVQGLHTTARYNAPPTHNNTTYFKHANKLKTFVSWLWLSGIPAVSPASRRTNTNLDLEVALSSGGTGRINDVYLSMYVCVCTHAHTLICPE
jgi:hypothetical protein